MHEVAQFRQDQKKQGEQNDFTEKAIMAIYKRLDRLEHRMNDFDDVAPSDVKQRLENQIRTVGAYLARLKSVELNLQNMLARYELFTEEAMKAAKEAASGQADSQSTEAGDPGELSQEGVSELGESSPAAEGA